MKGKEQKVEERLQVEHLPDTAVALVQNGEISSARGTGMADGVLESVDKELTAGSRPVRHSESASAAEPAKEPALRLGQDASRLQGFSDGVFALSATLLVVTLGEVPSSYDELLASVARFPAFALAFAALVSLWNNHREFFSRYPLADGWTVVLNSLLLFIVLLYVYPLKLLSEVVAESLVGAAPAVTASMSVAEIRGLYLIFGAAVVAGLALLTAMHLRAWKLRDELALDELGRYELRQEVVVYAAIVLVSVLSLLTAALGLGLRWGLPVWLLILLSPLVILSERLLTAGRRRQLRASAREK